MEDSIGDKILSVIGNLLIIGFWGLVIYGLVTWGRGDDSSNDYKAADFYNASENLGEVTNSYTSYDTGYNWADNNDVDNFDDCQDKFGTSLAEDGCNEYVKENYSGYRTFGNYECTEDCSGHEAGYQWAENNGIETEDDCSGYSNSFIEGCMSFVEDNY